MIRYFYSREAELKYNAVKHTV